MFIYIDSKYNCLYICFFNAKTMNHLIIKSHTELCEKQKQTHSLYQFQSNEHLIYHDFKFHLIENCDCLQGHTSNCEWIESLLNEAIKAKKIDWYDCNRGYHYDSAFRKSIRSGKIFTDVIHEVNYRYIDMVGKQYAIASKIKYIDRFSKGNKEVTKSYEKAKQFLIDNDIEYKLSELKELYLANIIYEPELTFTDISEFRKHLNKLIKNKKS